LDFPVQIDAFYMQESKRFNMIFTVFVNSESKFDLPF